jgi:hypothetical protein
MSSDPLFEAAEDAARVLPIAWRRNGDLLQGGFDGNQGSYAVTVATPGGSAFLVRAVRAEPIPDEAAERVELLCMDWNWAMPNTCFFFSRGFGGRVVSAASIGRREFDGVPEPPTLENTIRGCLLHAELVTHAVQGAVEGDSLTESTMFRTHVLPRLLDGEAHGVPECLEPRGPQPASDEQLIDACEAAARAAGWQAFRRADDQLVVQGATFVDVHMGCLIVSSYPCDDQIRPERRTAVASLLNQLLDRGAPFGLALDLAGGTVAGRTTLDLRGRASIPSHAELRDVIVSGGEGSLYHVAEIERVAGSGRPFGTTGGSLQERLHRRRAG